MSRFWGVRVGEGGKYAGIARERGFVAISWEHLGDLTWIAEAKDEKAMMARLMEVYESAYNVTGLKASMGAGQVRRFAREIADGDIVFLPHSAKSVVYVGRVKGGFRFVPNPTDGCPYEQRRDVEWIRDIARKDLPEGLRSSLGALTTVFSLGARADEARAVSSEEPPATAANVAKPVKDVVQHVIDRLYAIHPKAFEEFVAAYFSAIGYDAEPTQYVSDGGIDVVGLLDAEGLAQVLLRVQVKRTKANVGIETVLKTRGALAVDEQGAIVSLGGFTAQATQEAQARGKKTIVLVDGETFAEMLLTRFDDLPDEARQLLGVKPKDAIPVRDRFLVDTDLSAGE